MVFLFYSVICFGQTPPQTVLGILFMYTDIPVLAGIIIHIIFPSMGCASTDSVQENILGWFIVI